ncbi:hypothetical protein [Serratia sp. (in: enterobacteria)]|uniref:hypothetical protein n=1 Tax=Serratia sp. (in: enterobacteria) TaxID=616 RepID=UPI003988FE9B
MGNQLDKFNIKMIYATRVGAREWYMNNSNPSDDSRVGGDFEDDIGEGNTNDGWTVKDDGQVRLHVSPEKELVGYSNPSLDHSVAKGRGYMSSSKDWDMRGFEMTARIKCTNHDSDDGRFIMKGPSGSHKSNTVDCSGSSYTSRFFVADTGSDAGTTEFSKEQWHVHYVNKSGSHKSTGLGHIFNKWVICKYIVYTTKSSDGTKTFVKIELWLNVNNDGITFKKVNETVDSGGWGDDATRCGADRDDEIMTWRAPNLTFRWDGPAIRFKDLSIREVDPSKIAGDSSEPAEPPAAGTVHRDWDIKYNIISFPIDSCSLGQDTTTLTKIYDVTDDGSQSNLHKDRYRVAVLANGSSSQMIGKKPKRIVLRLSKTGNPPAGNVTCVLRKGSDDEVAVTYTYTAGGGNLAASALTTSKADYTFENLTANYSWQTGDRLCVEYSGNTVDTTNEVNVYRNSDDPFDGANTCAIKFDAGGVPPTAYTSPDVFRDYAFVMYE